MKSEVRQDIQAVIGKLQRKANVRLVLESQGNGNYALVRLDGSKFSPAMTSRDLLRYVWGIDDALDRLELKQIELFIASMVEIADRIRND
jgi:hypothetical protein